MALDTSNPMTAFFTSPLSGGSLCEANRKRLSGFKLADIREMAELVHHGEALIKQHPDHVEIAGNHLWATRRMGELLNEGGYDEETPDETRERWEGMAETHARAETGLLLTDSNKHLFSDADCERWRLAKLAYVEGALEGVDAMVEATEGAVPVNDDLDAEGLPQLPEGWVFIMTDGGGWAVAPAPNPEARMDPEKRMDRHQAYDAFMGLVEVLAKTPGFPTPTLVERGVALQTSLIGAAEHLGKAERQIAVLLDKMRDASGEDTIKAAMKAERQKCALDLADALQTLPPMVPSHFSRNLRNLTAKGWLAVMRGEVTALEAGSALEHASEPGHFAASCLECEDIREARLAERERAALDLERSMETLPASVNLRTLTAKGWLAAMNGEVPT